MESYLSMNALFCFACPPARLLIAAGFPAGQSWGKGGRCRRHVPTAAQRQPMPEFMTAWATTVSVFAGGKKTERTDGVYVEALAETFTEDGSGQEIQNSTLTFPQKLNIIQPNGPPLPGKTKLEHEQNTLKEDKT